MNDEKDITDKYASNWLIRFFVEIDKFFNLLTGGKRDEKRKWTSEHTISARIGRYSDDSNVENYRPLWELFEAIVNLAFYPVDGPYHCGQAYIGELKKDNEDDFKKGSAFMMVLLMLVLLLACIPISLVLWTWRGIKGLF